MVVTHHRGVSLSDVRVRAEASMQLELETMEAAAQFSGCLGPLSDARRHGTLSCRRCDVLEEPCH